MAWKWYGVSQYKASVGGSTEYGAVQLFGTNFYASLIFHKGGPLPNPTTQIVGADQRFYGHLDYPQMQAVVDLLRNEKPLQFGWDEQNPNVFKIQSGAEPVGEGDGLLASG
jgi:hypothetical protein